MTLGRGMGRLYEVNTIYSGIGRRGGSMPDTY
jgi:hypothetical protein